jgi:subtilisin family serine protease
MSVIYVAATHHSLAAVRAPERDHFRCDRRSNVQSAIASRKRRNIFSLACACLLLGAAQFVSGPAYGVERNTLPHEERLLALAAAPGGTRVLVTLQTLVDTASVNGMVEQQRHSVIADAQATFAARLAGSSGRVVHGYRAFPIVLVQVDQAALEYILGLNSVRGVQENHANHVLDNSNDVVMGASGAWNSGFSGNDEIVAVLDTGVQESHPFLSIAGTTGSRVVAELEGCFSGVGGSATGVSSLCPGGVYSETGDPNGHLDGTHCDLSVGGCEHGTHVAGIVAGTGTYVGGNNENGAAIGANIMPVQVFSCLDGGSGCAIAAFDSDIIAALDWVHYAAVNTTYRIAAVNLSLGVSGSHYTSDCDATASAYKTAIDTLRNTDAIATVIAAGNDGFTDGVDYPACVSSAISVSATDNLDNLASFSNSADFVSLYAPGVAVYSSVPGSGYGYLSGTSMAAPQVAGAFAILQSKFNHQATIDQLLTILQKTGKPVSANGYARARIDIGAAADDILVDGFGD